MARGRDGKLGNLKEPAGALSSTVKSIGDLCGLIEREGEGSISEESRKGEGREKTKPKFLHSFMSLPDMVDVADKLAYFQAITGLEDPDICTEILAAHGWDLERAVSSFTATNSESSASAAADYGGGNAHFDPAPRRFLERSELHENAAPAPAPAPAAGLAWKIITLPISVISGSLGLVSGAVSLGLWAAGGILSYSLGVIGLGSGSGSGRNAESSARLVSVSAAASEAIDFVSAFERDYGSTRPNFVGEGFMDALQRSRNAFKLLFVYLHSPDHPDTPFFCDRTLCSETIAAFVNENFVSWGGSIRASEGFKMSNSLKASRYPFCAVVMAATNQRIALLQQVFIFIAFLFKLLNFITTSNMSGFRGHSFL